MTRSERLALERVLTELEIEMRKVQEEIDELRRRLGGTGMTKRRRAPRRLCAKHELSKSRM
jgi:hypothetical protein